MMKKRLLGALGRSRAVIGAVCAFFVLTGVWTVITYYYPVSNSLMGKAAYGIFCACVVGASAGNAYSSAGRGWLNGLIGGSAFVAVSALAAFVILGGSGFDVLGFARKVPLYLVISLVGGIAGINFK